MAKTYTSLFEGINKNILKQYNWLYNSHYSTYLSDPRGSLISGFEHCVAYANIIDINEVRKNISRALFGIAFLTITGVGLGIPTLIIPVMVANLAKIYVFSHGLDYLGVLLAQRSEIELDENKSQYLKMFSTISYALSNTIMIAGMSSIIAAPLTGAISAVHLKLASEVIIPIANALIRTISYEATKWKASYIGSEIPQLNNTDFLLKALINGIGYNLITGLAGNSKLISALAYVSVRSFSNAYVEADKDITQVPSKLWKNINSSLALSVEFFIFDLSDKLTKSLFSSTVSLSALMFKSLNMQMIDRLITSPIKAHFKGIDETITQTFSNLYKYTNKTADRIISKNFKTNVLSQKNNSSLAKTI